MFSGVTGHTGTSPCQTSTNSATSCVRTCGNIWTWVTSKECAIWWRPYWSYLMMVSDKSGLTIAKPWTICLFCCLCRPCCVNPPCCVNACVTEAKSYSCFCQLMKRMNSNFPHGGAMDVHFANMRSLIQVGTINLLIIIPTIITDWH